MFKKLLLTFFLLFSSSIIIYPSKKENTNLFDYCYSFEKILARNSFEKNNKEATKFKNFAKDVTFFPIWDQGSASTARLPTLGRRFLVALIRIGFDPTTS